MRRVLPEGRVSEMDRLIQIMDRLRGPDGCPWDREQTYETLATFLLEETYETLEAMRSGAPAAHLEELGDLLFQIVFQARVAKERGEFDIEELMRMIGDKIVRRHPHVFGDGVLTTSDQVLAQWEQIKNEERRSKPDGSMFDGVPAELPALLKALRISSKASRVGFDWPDLQGVMEKFEEEAAELRQALRAKESAAIKEEIGDLLFTIANVARRAGVDPELALQGANRKFMERFRYMEKRLVEEGLKAAPEYRTRMEELWDESKKAVRRTSPARKSPCAGTSGSVLRRARRGARS
ncbi:MAG: nucleoside triphosphate pyrophosphohydrolase [Acidobacteria bacterium 13_1_40CM_4_69_4]|nr:MAG: nucleoside triphosphate pyrophosphohydrolase [Acidobacteria bacterium 13_1_40CM_4_69_4]